MILELQEQLLNCNRKDIRNEIKKEIKFRQNQLKKIEQCQHKNFNKN